MEDNTTLRDKLKFIRVVVGQLCTADGATTSDVLITNNLLNGLIEKELMKTKQGFDFEKETEERFIELWYDRTFETPTEVLNWFKKQKQK